MIRSRHDVSELDQVAKRIEVLLRDGMQPHEIVAAFQAKRRMRAHGDVPWVRPDEPELIGHLPLAPRIMLAVYEGDGDE